MIFKIQGIYYLVTGIWPVIHIESFLQLTGGKTDLWLVKMVGLLSFVIGMSLCYHGKRSDKILAIGSAMAFLLIDVYYSLNGTISKIYLIDGLCQLAFIAVITFSTYAKRAFPND